MHASVIHGDVRDPDVIDRLPGGIDALITDPPYNISSEFELTRDGSGRYGDKTDLTSEFGDWDHGDIYTSDWLTVVADKLSETAVVVVFYDYFNLHHVIEPLRELGFTLRQPVVWHKSNPPPQGLGVKWQEAAEIGVIATRNDGKGHHYQQAEGQRHNVVETPLCMGNERYSDPKHATQKPEALFAPLLRWWTQPGDTVLDPFCGTGTVPVVAKQMACSYIGIDADETWAETARDRLADTHWGARRDHMDTDTTTQSQTQNESSTTLSDY